MIAAIGFEQKTVAVLGLGRTGLSAIRALQKGGARIIAWDDNQANRKTARAAGIECQDLARRDWTDIAALILSPGIPHTHPEPHHVVKLARAVGVPIVGDTELFAQTINALPEKHRPLVIGITGTNGKSTTTALLTHILRDCGRDAHAGGNIGTACLDLPEPHAGMIYVLELSSYQLELTQNLRCNGAILLNLSPDHLDRHDGFEGYVAAKRRIFTGQRQEDVAIISMDDPHSQSLCMSARVLGKASVIPVSANSTLSQGISCAAGKLYTSCAIETKYLADIATVPALRGQHNGLNAAAAFAAARHVGIAGDSIAAAMKTFPGLAHRMEVVDTVQGAQFINDSKATNADAVRQALGAFDNIYWIAGGQAKADGIAGLEPYLGAVQKAFLIGEAQNAFARQLGGKLDTALCDTLEIAVTKAFAAALDTDAPDPVVLLSPACASFDQFKDFEARGEAFRRAVSDIAGAQKKKRPA